ncbi:MAG: tripartite tricarboxylate transporter TctB family protein [Bacteroidota bacterium]
MQRRAIHRDAFSGVLLISLSLWVLWYSRGFPQLDNGYPGPSLFPVLIAGSIGLAGLWLAYRGLRQSGTPRKPRTAKSVLSGLARLLTGIALAALYPVLINYTHFIPVMAFLILFVALMLKHTAWHAMLMAILSASLIYGLFTQLLNVPL